MISRKILYLVLLLTTVYLSVAFLEPLPTVMISVEIVVFFLMAVYLLLSFWKINVSLKKVPRSVVVGNNLKTVFLLKNMGILPVIYGELTFDISYVQGRRKKKMVIPFSISSYKEEYVMGSFDVGYTGTLLIKNVCLRCYDPLKLLKIKKRLSIKEISILVIPKPYIIEVNNKATMFSVLNTRNRTGLEENFTKYYTDRAGEDVSEVFQLRDYREGDRLSRINWKLSAKNGELIVKDYSCPIIDRTCIYIDLNCESQSDFHNRTTLAMSLAVSCLYVNASVTVLWYDEKKETLMNHHVEKFEDLYECMNRCLGTSMCNDIDISKAVNLVASQSLFKQLMVVSGKADEKRIFDIDFSDVAEGMYYFCNDNEGTHIRRLSENIICYDIPFEDKKALSRISIDLL